MNRPDDEAKPQTAEAGSNALEERDTLSETARLNLLADTSTGGTWYDTKCGVCSRRCCSPCTADGDISQCAQTRGCAATFPVAITQHCIRVRWRSRQRAGADTPGLPLAFVVELKVPESSGLPVPAGGCTMDCREAHEPPVTGRGARGRGRWGPASRVIGYRVAAADPCFWIVLLAKIWHNSPWQKAPLHSTGDASRLTALFLGKICPICSLVTPCSGRARHCHDRVSVQRGVSPRADKLSVRRQADAQETAKPPRREPAERLRRDLERVEREVTRLHKRNRRLEDENARLKLSPVTQ